MTIDDASRIRSTGGSFLRTSRTNPAKDDASLDRAVASLDALGVRYLICIGGDDTTFGAAAIAKRANGRIGVATVPKTIDNDLPLPDNAPTFGFETARSVGAQIIESLLEDARTTVRWYIVVCMGRKSGALALGMANAGGATLAVIPEEFQGGDIHIDRVVDVLCGAIVKAKRARPRLRRRRCCRRHRRTHVRATSSRVWKMSRATPTDTCASPTFRSARCCAIACARA